ncbi:hypothetical protein PAPYR_539 [Paratrimastix pyriformis]|uniref:F-box domain-containing protein n=1 Tax=Paratrimastix pyriformis TaxID=342808 RepID=A0ABQ8UUN4_9EUKA|nr:hypothetical protein PAPYR_539 [Paratrimastix pyriformis]
MNPEGPSSMSIIVSSSPLGDGPRQMAATLPRTSLWKFEEMTMFALPPELLLNIVETSCSPLMTYIQIMGLSHALRANIRGTLREISFDEEPDSVMSLREFATVTTDVLVALIGPCKNLTKLSLPKCSPLGGASIFRTTDPATSSWVEETFAGHRRLAILLGFPASLSVAERILHYLPGLGELHICGPCDTHLLTAVAQLCPNLQALRCLFALPERPAPDVAALLPLAASLQQLRVDFPSESMANLVCRLSSCWRLKACGCPPSALEPLAPHLTRLTLHSPEDIPGPWLCHLERLTLSPKSYSQHADLVRLLAANQATLRRLKLIITSATPQLVAALSSLPQLTHLRLIGPVLELPPELLDRLVALRLGTWRSIFARPLRIASRRLGEFRLAMRPRAGFRLSLDCPSLVEAHLPWILHGSGLHGSGQLVELNCPRVRTITGLPAQFTGPATTAMPDLEVVQGRSPLGWLAQLMSTIDAPRRLREVRVSHPQPDLLARLCASGTLVSLRLDLDTAKAPPNPLVLRLPRQLERLQITISSPMWRAATDAQPMPFDIQVEEAPGLRSFQLSTAPTLPVRLCLGLCPNLVVLHLLTAGLVSADLAEVIAPRGLHLDGKALSTASSSESVLRCLTQHGSRLHRVSVVSTPDPPTAWPQLVSALCGLPQLTSLSLSFTRPELSLACPQLRVLELYAMETRLQVDGKPVTRRLVLACPFLEELSGCFNGEVLGQLEFAMPAPHLRWIRKVSEPWLGRLAEMCPGAACLYPG